MRFSRMPLSRIPLRRMALKVRISCSGVGRPAEQMPVMPATGPTCLLRIERSTQHGEDLAGAVDAELMHDTNAKHPLRHFSPQPHPGTKLMSTSFRRRPSATTTPLHTLSTQYC